MDKKTITISEKRQFTIPKKFFTLLGFDRQAECTVRNNELIVRPLQTGLNEDFAPEILQDLLEQDISKDHHLAALKEKQAMVRPAVEKMISAAERVAAGKENYETYDDVFVSEI